MPGDARKKGRGKQKSSTKLGCERGEKGGRDWAKTGLENTSKPEISREGKNARG